MEELSRSTITISWSHQINEPVNVAIDCDPVVAESMLRRALDVVREQADEDMCVEFEMIDVTP